MTANQSGKQDDDRESGQTKVTGRDARLASALRRNLLKRKEQMRARSAIEDSEETA